MTSTAEPQKSGEDFETSRYRQIPGVPGRIIKVFAAALPLYIIAYFIDVLRPLGFWVDRQAFLASFLGLILCLTFLLVPAGKRAPRGKLPLYDTILAFLGIAGGGYAAFFFNELRWREGSPYMVDVVFGLITVILLLEATRRLVGWPFLGVALAFLLYARFTYLLPGLLSGRGYSISRIVSSLYIGKEGIFGTPTDLAAGVIFMFVLFGQVLVFGGGGDWIIRLAQAIAGPYRGGPAKVAVVASGLFGTISGSAAANVATTGVFTIPMMKKIGYKPHFAAAVEATASTGGVIMPPVMGAVAFLMAEYLDVSYATIAVAAFLPACLYYIAVFAQVHLEAVKTGLKGVPRSELASVKEILPQGWLFIIPMGVLVYFLLIKSYDPAISGLYASIAVVLVSLIKKETRIGPRRLFNILEQSSRGLLLIAVTCATSGVVIAMVSTTGLGVKLSQLLVELAGGNMFVLLLLTALTSTVLGMGLPVLPAYVMLVILIAPALVQMEISRLAAHMFIMYYAVLSFITPPVAPAVYVASGLARSDIMKTGLQAVRLGIVAYIVPFMFIYSPALLLKGAFTEVLLAVGTSIVGALALSCGIEGYALKPASWPQRLLLALSGVLMIIPGWETDLIGIVILMGVLAWQYSALRATVATAVRTGNFPGTKRG